LPDFDELPRLPGSPVRHIAALTGDPAKAFGHVQEAFIRAWKPE
jgi:hypothetical protein